MHRERRDERRHLTAGGIRNGASASCGIAGSSTSSTSACIAAAVGVPTHPGPDRRSRPNARRGDRAVLSRGGQWEDVGPRRPTAAFADCSGPHVNVRCALELGLGHLRAATRSLFASL
jgi:hypothetical protein